MSIAEQITRIQDNIAASYAECSAKGATLPAEENSANLPDTIASITAGGGGDSVEYTNITGDTIAKGSKVWLNKTATATEKQYDFSGLLGGYAAAIYMTSNPNIGLSSDSNGGLYLVNFSDTGTTSQQIASSLRSFPFNIMTIDKNNYFLSLDSGNCVCIYNIDMQSTQYYTTGRVSRYILGANYMATRASEYGDHIIINTNPATGEILKTYKASESTYETIDKCGYEMNGTVYAVYNWYGYKIGKVVFDDSALTYSIENSVAMSKNYVLGGISDASLIFVGSYASENTQKLYNFEIISADTLEKVDSTTLPEAMQQCLNNPTVLFINDYSSLFTAYIPNLKKFVILQYVNGQWVDKSPIITAEDFSQDKGLTLAGFSSSADFSRMIYPTSTQSDYYNVYSGNEKSGGYYAVPYLYSNKQTVTGKAEEDCANNAQSTANTTIAGGGSGSEVEAINYSGKDISEGDKVWLVPQNTAGSESFTQFTTSSYNGFLNRDGTTIYSNSDFKYDIESKTKTTIANPYGGGGYFVRYGKNDIYIKGVNGFIPTTGIGFYSLILNRGKNNYVFCWLYDDLYVDENGKVIYKDEEIGDISGKDYHQDNMIFDHIQNYLYVGDWITGKSNTFGIYRYKLDLENKTVTLDNNFYYEMTSQYIIPLGVTLDSKYIIGCADLGHWNSSDNRSYMSSPVIYEITETSLKELTDFTKLSEDLKDVRKNTYISINYNGEDDIMCYRFNKYVWVYKYKDGKFNLISKVATTVEDSSYVLPTFSASADGKVITEKNKYIVLENTDSKYKAISFATGAVTSDTISGIARENAESGETFKVGVVLPTE